MNNKKAIGKFYDIESSISKQLVFLITHSIMILHIQTLLFYS